MWCIDCGIEKKKEKISQPKSEYTIGLEMRNQSERCTAEYNWQKERKLCNALTVSISITGRDAERKRGGLVDKQVGAGICFEKDPSEMET